MVYDAEWLREAFIKHFSKLTDRRPIRLGNELDHGLFNLKGEHWKHVRALLSPSFTQGKLKKVCLAIIVNEGKTCKELYYHELLL